MKLAHTVDPHSLSPVLGATNPRYITFSIPVRYRYITSSIVCYCFFSIFFDASNFHYFQMRLVHLLLLPRGKGSMSEGRHEWKFSPLPRVM